MTASSTGSPFARSDVVGRYEDWYSTPYGALADRIERGLIRELLSPVGPGASVLEVGCGTGHFGAALAKDGFHVVGVEPEEAMLAIARERVPAVRGDGQYLPFRDGSFDAVVIVAVLEFVADPVRLLSEARRVARRRVVLLTLASRSWLGLRRRLAGRIGHPIFSRVRFRSRKELVALAKRAGAEPERVRTVLFLPPALAGRLPRLEAALSRGALPGGGMLGLSLPAGRGSA